MKAVTLAKIKIDEKGWLRLFPAGGGYDYIYRAAADVHWDKEGRFLHSRERREWTYSVYFKHIVSVVASEYGDLLELGSNTKWVKVPEEVRRDIEKEE